jgi:hypothetical protein
LGKKAIVILTVFLIIGCGRLKGEFAFKRSFQDAYRRIDGPLNFEINETIHWVYIFNTVNKVYNINITLLKKELVWVDINSRMEMISESNKIIYGTIENLDIGTYKIILNYENNMIDEREFVIFSEEEEYYRYEDQ